MRRRITVLLLFALSGSLVFATGATSVTGTDHVGTDVRLVPTSDYAYLGEGGDLAIDLSGSNSLVTGDGVSPRSRTRFADLFRVRYTGPRHARVWFTDDSRQVTFTARGRPVQSKGDAVVLDPNESVTVGLRVDANDATDDILSEFAVRTVIADVGQRDSGSGRGNVDERDGTATRTRCRLPDERSALGPHVIVEPSAMNDGDRTVVAENDGGTLTLTDVQVLRNGSRVAGSPAPTSTSVRSGTRGPDPDAVILGAVCVPSRADVGANTVVKLQFEVDETYAAAEGVDPETLTGYRYCDDEWRELDVAITDRREGRYTVETHTPCLGTLVIATENPFPRSTPETDSSDGPRMVTDEPTRTSPVGDSERNVPVPSDGSAWPFDPIGWLVVSTGLLLLGFLSRRMGTV